MIPEEEIEKNIIEMGYVVAKPRLLAPSYYKLNDGNILKALVSVNHVVPDPRQPDGFSANTSNLLTVFVPKHKRKPELFAPYNPADVNKDLVDEDVEFEVLRENFSVYELSNGLVLSVKTVVGQVKKTKHYTVDGEPIYTINVNPVIKIKKAGQ